MSENYSNEIVKAFVFLKSENIGKVMNPNQKKWFDNLMGCARRYKRLSPKQIEVLFDIQNTVTQQINKVVLVGLSNPNKGYQRSL